MTPNGTRERSNGLPGQSPQVIVPSAGGAVYYGSQVKMLAEGSVVFTYDYFKSLSIMGLMR
jgi:hypothetical protein